MSVAFRRESDEEHKEPRFELPIPAGPNLVTEDGPKVIDWTNAADGWRFAGRWEPETHVGALSLIVPEGLTPQDLGAILDGSFEIAVRPGLHCAPLAHQALGTTSHGGTTRLSFGPFLSVQDIHYAADALAEIAARGSVRPSSPVTA